MFGFEGWWFVDLDSELGWVPASYLEPRDGSMDDQILEIYEEGEGKVVKTIYSHKNEKAAYQFKI